MPNNDQNATHAGVDSVTTIGRSGMVRRFGYAIAVAICLALLVRVLLANRELLAKLLEQPLRWDFLLLAVGCVFINQAMTIVRWFLLIRALQIPLRFWDAMGMGVIGELGHFLMPSSNGGDLLKMGMVFSRDLPKTQMLVSTIVDRATGLYGLLICSGLAGAAYWPRADSQMARLIVCLWVLLAIALLCGLSFLHPRIVQAINGIARRFSYIQPVMEQLEQAADAYRQRWHWVLSAIVISMVSQSLTFSAIHLISKALTSQNRLEWGLTFIAAPLAMISTALPIPFGAIGVGEQICEELFHSLGSAGGGLSFFVFRFALLTSSVLLGLIWVVARYVFNRRKKGKRLSLASHD